jgi:hypothetical protein
MIAQARIRLTQAVHSFASYYSLYRVPGPLRYPICHLVSYKKMFIVSVEMIVEPLREIQVCIVVYMLAK